MVKPRRPVIAAVIAGLMLCGTATAVLHVAPGGPAMLTQRPLFQAPSGPAYPVPIEASPIEIRPVRLDGLVLRHADVWRSDSEHFGGFSGLEIESGRFVAITDRAHFLFGTLADTGEGLRPAGTWFLRMREISGLRMTMPTGDSEGLTLDASGTMAVAFEVEPRVIAFDASGEPVSMLEHAVLSDLPRRRGPEALATLPGGGLLVLAEDLTPDGAPVLLIRPDGTTRRGALPVPWGQRVTGADAGPDGRLYVVTRGFWFLLGLSVRVMRYDLDADGMPIGATARELGAFAGPGGIDNMEGITVWTDASGGTRLTLISDDNRLFLQRTIVVDFDVTG